MWIDTWSVDISIWWTSSFIRTHMNMYRVANSSATDLCVGRRQRILRCHVVLKTNRWTFIAQSTAYMSVSNDMISSLGNEAWHIACRTITECSHIIYRHSIQLQFQICRFGITKAQTILFIIPVLAQSLCARFHKQKIYIQIADQINSFQSKHNE